MKTMEILIKRKEFGETYTLGDLLIDNKLFCQVLEPTDRGINNGEPLESIKKKKIDGKTAIGIGNYDVVITYSEHFKMRLPLLVGTNGFSQIRIHVGNFAEKDSRGCLLCGIETETKGYIKDSKKTLESLMKKLESEKTIHLTIEYT